MRPNSYYYDDLNTPPPPPCWKSILVAALFFIFMTALAIFCTSCVCSITCRPDVPAAIEIIETIATK